VLGVAAKMIAGCVLELFCEDINPPHPMPAIKTESKKTNMIMRETNRMSTSKLKCAVDQGITCVAVNAFR
jgi:hypothetical protein